MDLRETYALIQSHLGEKTLIITACCQAPFQPKRSVAGVHPQTYTYKDAWSVCACLYMTHDVTEIQIRYYRKGTKHMNHKMNVEENAPVFSTVVPMSDLNKPCYRIQDGLKTIRSHEDCWTDIVSNSKRLNK